MEYTPNKLMKPHPEVPLFFKIFQCIFPFIVIGFGTVLTGDSLPGFGMFYIINCICYTAYVVQEIPAYKEIWRRVKSTSLQPNKDIRQLAIGILLCLASVVIISVYGYYSKPQYFTKQVVDIDFKTIIGVVAFVFVFVFINPMFEEFYWRVFTYEVFGGSCPGDDTLCKYATSIGYGMYHFWMVYYTNGFLAGILMGFFVSLLGFAFYWQRRSGGIFNAYIFHMGIDLGEIFMMYFQKIASISVTLMVV